MSSGAFRTLKQVASAVILAIAMQSSHSDVDEASIQRSALPDGVQPLLALIIDTSDATAGSIVVQESYDPDRDYGSELSGADRCDAARLYWRRGAGPAPDCRLQAGIEISPSRAVDGLQCEIARQPLGIHGFFIASRAAQWNPDGDYWSDLDAESTNAVECRADRGRHGATAGAWFASDGPGGPWRLDAAREIRWDASPLADPYILYSGNFLNYLNAPTQSIERPIAEVMLQRMAAALAATAELEVAMIRVDPDGPDGGYVARAPVAGALAVPDLLAMAGESPTGNAALAETLAESAAWLSGGAIRFGNDQRLDPAAVDPMAPGRYRTPFSHACRPVSLAYLTAVAPSGDEMAVSAANALPNFVELTGGCGMNCLAPLEQWIESADLSDTLAGAQNASMYWIAPDAAASGNAGPSDSAADPLAFINVVARGFQRDAAVPAVPQLSAAGLTPFSGASSGPGILFGLTAPVARERWPGNLFRYALRAPALPLAPPAIVDNEGETAIDTDTGLPKAGSQSLWSDSPDSNLLAGGAAGRLPATDARRIYSDVAGPHILDPGNRLAPGIDWLAAQRTPGDPGPDSPLVVDYPASGRQVAYVSTQDGLLQAFDAENGVERWAWIPKELLGRLPALMRDEPTTVRSHGIDGPLVLHRHDPDGDGHIDTGAGEHLWLLFGLGRGGNRYYALDIASPDDPILLWSSDLAGRDVEASSEPLVARLAIDGSGQSHDDWVVLLSGGYDRRFDSQQATGAGTGNMVLILDAATGRQLWSGGDGNEHDLRITGMATLPSAPRALDIDGDGQLDRAYLVDVVGGLWRLDFATGQAAAELVDARLLARLGTGEQRFHATPDVSIARIGEENRIAIAVGSGWLARPRDTSIVDRLYVVFDRETTTASGPLTESDLYDMQSPGNALPTTAPGWYTRLDGHGQGEKVIGPTVTFDNAIRFQTYQPLPNGDAAPCGPPRAVSRSYVLDVRSGLAHSTAVESEDEDVEEIAGPGLPVGPRFGFPVRWDETCTGCRPRPFGVIGGKTFDTGYAGDPVKTSWRKLSPAPVSR